MNYDVIITNGVILGADGERRGDVAIAGETIAAVGPGLAEGAGPSTEVVDATGRYVIPGGIDVHVHLELPFCGTVSSDDWSTGTRAAARGGVTTVIDIAITNWDRHGTEIETLVKMGCPTFKEFMIYASEGWQADDRALFNTLERC